ncbi:phosphatidate cytidylyltransferase [Thiovibrio sp. JS02]
MKRLITGVAAVIAWLLLIFLGPYPVFWLAITALAAVAFSEYLAMALPAGNSGHAFALCLFGILPVVAAFPGEPGILLAGLVLSLLGLMLYGLFCYPRLLQPFDLISRSGFGSLYIGLASAHLILLMGLPQGRYWLLFLTAITAASDTAAYYTGSLLGKNKLCPAISPGKTWEGFFGGLCGSLLASFAVKFFFLPEESNLWIGFLALLLSCLGVAGDLSESMLKRAFGVKDSGTILPGHGGLLDRIDSLLLTAPALYYLLHFYARIP